jgi:hypothetical protein
VTLAGDEHDVARRRLRQGHGDGGATVGLGAGFAPPTGWACRTPPSEMMPSGSSVPRVCPRSRPPRRRGGPPPRPIAGRLARIPVTAAPEGHDHPSLAAASRGRAEGRGQALGSVREVDDHREGLPLRLARTARARRRRLARPVATSPSVTPVDDGPPSPPPARWPTLKRPPTVGRTRRPLPGETSTPTARRRGRPAVGHREARHRDSCGLQSNWSAGTGFVAVRHAVGRQAPASERGRALAAKYRRPRCRGSRDGRARDWFEHGHREVWWRRARCCSRAATTPPWPRGARRPSAAEGGQATPGSSGPPGWCGHRSACRARRTAGRRARRSTPRRCVVVVLPASR